MKKVLVFLSSGVGGAERMSVNIARHLQGIEYDVEFVLVGDDQASILEFLPEISKYQIVKGGAIKVIYELNRLIKIKKPDFVFSSIKPISIKLLLFRWLFPNSRYIIRCDNYLSYYAPKSRWLVSLLYKKADHIIAQTEEMKEELVARGVSNMDIIVLHNPIESSLIEEKLKQSSAFVKEKTKKYFVAIGRFSSDKGFDVLIKAFALVVDKEPNVELYVVGKKDGYASDYYQRLVNIAKESNVFEKIHFPGFTSNPYSYLKNADCFVLASRREGLPNTLLDALYMGVPSVATTCIPIISRIVKDGVNGYLAEMENPVSLAQAMLKAPSLGKVGLEDYKAATYDDFVKLFS